MGWKLCFCSVGFQLLSAVNFLFRNRSGNLEKNLWTASNAMEARANESFEVFFMGSYPQGEAACPLETVPESAALVALQHYSNTLVFARGLAITPDNV